MNRLISRVMIVMLALMGAYQSFAQDQPQKLASIRLNAGMHLIQAEVA